MRLGHAGIIVRAEDAFAISVADDEAAAMATAGDLLQIVLTKIESDSEGISSRCFYLVRKGIEETLGLERRSIHEATWLEPLMPRETRKAQWKQIAKRSGLRFPKLEHPRKWRDGFMLFSMLLATIPVAAVWWSLYEIGWLSGIGLWLFSIPALIGWVLGVSRINRRLLDGTPRLAYTVPFDTAGELAVAVLALNFDELQEMSAGERPGKDAVWMRLVGIVCEELQISPDEVRPDSPLTKDMRVPQK
jgi:hypothetical protein